MATIRAQTWVEDAQLLHDEQSLRNIENSILRRTPSVEEFLDNAHVSSTAIVGPKGFGKTFVLKLKRVALQELDYFCLPQHGVIVERFLVGPPHLSGEEIDFLSSSTPWESIWGIAFSLTILKAAQQQQPTEPILRELLERVEAAPIKTMISDDRMRRPYQFVDGILRLSRRLISECIRDAQSIGVAFSHVRTKIALFVDNIDEYMDEYLREETKGGGGFDKRLRMWHCAQIGAWVTLRQMHGGNPHARIFVSIRIEAYHAASTSLEQFANLQSFSVLLNYSRDDLVAIIENNIQAEPPTRLADPAHVDPLGRFVGHSALTVVNGSTGEVENLMDYWLRHCIGRPRDAVWIGHDIGKLSLADRKGPRIRTVINSRAATIVGSLFGEAKHHLQYFAPDLLPLILTKNVMSSTELKEASNKYNDLYLTREGLLSADGAHIFCSLYSLGLIGVVQGDQNDPGVFYQSFPEMGQFPLGKNCILPAANEYLIHPALTDFIAKHDTTFISRLSRTNIIGHSRPWRNPDDYVYVAVGDIRRFRTQVMDRSGPAQAFDEFWKDVFDRCTKNLLYRKPQAGDSFVLADPSPVKVLRSCVGLARRLRESKFELEVRVGAHSGFWRLAEDWEPSAVLQSDVVGIAARIEPLTQPGKVFATEQFVKGLEHMGARGVLGHFYPVQNSETLRIREDGTIKISKQGEPPQYVRLSELALTRQTGQE